MAKRIQEKRQRNLNSFKNTHIIQRGMNSSNQFQPLDDENGPASSRYQTSAVNKSKIPPIIATQKGFNPNLSQSLELSDITFKFISLGDKI